MNVNLVGPRAVPLIADPGVPPPSGHNWFFLNGWARTGTEALTRMLSMHPDCHCTFEAGFIETLHAILTAEGLSTNLADDGFYYDAAKAGAPWTFWQFRMMCEQWREARGRAAQVVGDKSYYYWVLRDVLREVFPDCTFVFSHRHPLDQLSSYATVVAPWLREGADEETLLQRQLCYLEQYTAACEIARSEEEDTVCIRFEDLATFAGRKRIIAGAWDRLSLSKRSAKQLGILATLDAPAGAVGRHTTCEVIRRLVAQAPADTVERIISRCGY